jgi:hypothetical protein
MNTDVHVYIICNGPNDGHSGPVKIGMADNPRTRLSGLQSGNPNKLVIWRTYPTPKRDIARYLERAFHDTQAKHRLSGEWFDLTPRQAEVLMYINLGTLLSSLGWAKEEVDQCILLVDRAAIRHEKCTPVLGLAAREMVPVLQ